MRALIASAIALSLPACSRDATTAPPSAEPPAATATQITDIMRDHPGIGDALVDASTRLAPSIADIVARAQLNDRLRDLSAQLEAGDVDKSRRALALARKALETSSKNGEQADLAAIGLALDQVGAALQPPDVPSSQP